MVSRHLPVTTKTIFLKIKTCAVKSCSRWFVGGENPQHRSLSNWFLFEHVKTDSMIFRSTYSIKNTVVFLGRRLKIRQNFSKTFLIIELWKYSILTYTCNSVGDKRFARARRTVQQNSSRSGNSESLKHFRVSQMKQQSADFLKRKPTINTDFRNNLTKLHTKSVLSCPPTSLKQRAGRITIGSEDTSSIEHKNSSK